MSCNSNNRQYNQIPTTDSTPVQKEVIINEGPGINVVDNSDTTAYRFTISAEDVAALTANLSIVVKVSDVVKSQPILKGTVIDEVNLSWEYNKAINSQTLTNDGGLTAPTLDSEDESYDYTTQSIEDDIVFTLQGNDGLGLSGSIANDTASILFGNQMIIGKGASQIGNSAAALEAFIDNLATKVNKTSRIHTYYATGGSNEKHFVAYPKAWGEAVFTKGIFSGGYVRLKNVAGTLKANLSDGDMETDISFTNPEGYEEDYYIYESLFDNQADAVTPFIIS